MMMLLGTMQSANAMSVDAFMDKHIAPISDAVAKVIFYPVNICGNKIPLIILWILFAGIFFTFFFRGNTQKEKEKIKYKLSQKDKKEKNYINIRK